MCMDPELDIERVEYPGKSFLNPDNRLMSSTTLSKEYELAKQEFGLSEDEEDKIIQNTNNSLFENIGY